MTDYLGLLKNERKETPYSHHSETMEKIDFVLPWVDGSDPVWHAEKQKWEDLSKVEKGSTDDANSDCRYRDDGLLRYWFRGVEKFAPWVNRIHFGTCGQKLDWLDENHPKLNLVNHEDFIPPEYLPTFNVRPIDMNYHRIMELSEHFVIFNDDVFLLQPVNEDFFFRAGNPVLDANLRYTNTVGWYNWSRVMFNDYCIVNSSFDTGATIWNNRRKWFCIKELGYKRVRRNILCYLANKALPVGAYGHVALPHLKSSFLELWEKHAAVLEQTSMQKFRSDDQVNQWLLCAWNQAKGSFYPANAKKRGLYIEVDSDAVDWICEVIRNQDYPQVCVNDSKSNIQPEYCARKLEEAFDAIMPEKSEYEKN